MPKNEHILTTLFAIPLLLYAILGFYTRLFLDDYCQVARAVDFGVFGSVIDKYAWAGRFTDTIVFSLFASWGHLPSQLAFAVLITLWFIGLYLLIQSVTMFKSKGKILLSAVTILMVVTSFVMHPQAFYWFAATSAHLVAPILGTFYLLAIFSASHDRLWQAMRIILAFLLSFFAAGANEGFAILMILLTVMLFFVRTPHLISSNRQSALVAGLGGSVLALIIILMSPGNDARIDESPQGLMVTIWLPLQLSARIMGDLIFYMQQSLGAILVAITTGGLIGWSQNTVTESVDNADYGISLRQLRYLLIILIAMNALLYFPLYSYSSYEPDIFGRYSTIYFVSLIVHSLWVVTLIGFLALVKPLHKLTKRLKQHHWWLLGIISLSVSMILAYVPLIEWRLLAVLNSLGVVLTVGFAILRPLNSEPVEQKISLIRGMPPRFASLARVLLWSSPLLLVVAYMAVPTFALGSTPSRAFYAPAAILTVLFMSLGYKLGFSLQNSFRYLSSQHQRIVQKSTVILFVCVMLLPIVNVQGFMVQLPQYQAYAQEWDARDTYLKNLRDSNTEETIILTPLENDIDVHRERILSPTSTQFLLDCMSSYYDLNIEFAPR